ncbi:MAG: hypothetical protein ACOCV2_14660 [Persicimonas sp.]
MHKLKIIVMTFVVAVALVACGEDDENNDNNENNENNASDAGDADNGDDDAGDDCEDEDEIECCDPLTGETSDPICEDGSWQCEDGLDEITPGGTCEEEENDGGNGDGGDGDGGDGGDDAG